MKRFFSALVLIVIACGALSAQSLGGTYAKNCANCHGADGSGNTALGRALKLGDLRSPEVKKLSDDQLAMIISTGADRGKMPAFAKKLGADTVRELAVYVHEIDRQPVPAPQTINPARVQATQLMDVKSVYSAKCSHCHGTDGSGNTVLGRTLKLRDLRSLEAQVLSDNELIAIIGNGTDRGRMPGFQKKLGSEMVEQLASSVRELAGRAPIEAPVVAPHTQAAIAPAPSLPATQVEAALLPTATREGPARPEENKRAEEPTPPSKWENVRSVIIPGSTIGRRTELVDLNSASKETLLTLPGITEADAISIIDARPYKSTLQFKIKNIITREKYAQIADRIMARQVPRKRQLSSIPAQP